MKKMLAILVHMSRNMWGMHEGPMPFDDAVWERTVNLAAQLGFNTVVLDVGDSVEFDSHPEIRVEGAWSKARVHKEVARCRALGLTLIPKLNFSAMHGAWLRQYNEMLATPTYWKVADDLIQEIYEMFESPAYIHIGMDEENEIYIKNNLRPGRLYWEDMRRIVDSVKATGAKPWIWADPLFEHPLMYATNFAPEECVISPWYYHAFKPEHFTPTDSAPEYINYYGRAQFAKLNLKFVEDDPFHSVFRSVALPLMQKGYCYVPCASVFNRCAYNTPELVEYFMEGAPQDQLLGFMTAPWFMTQEENWEKIENSLILMSEAAKKHGII